MFSKKVSFWGVILCLLQSNTVFSSALSVQVLQSRNPVDEPVLSPLYLSCETEKFKRSEVSDQRIINQMMRDILKGRSVLNVYAHGTETEKFIYRVVDEYKLDHRESEYNIKALDQITSIVLPEKPSEKDIALLSRCRKLEHIEFRGAVGDTISMFASAVEKKEACAFTQLKSLYFQKTSEVPSLQGIEVFAENLEQLDVESSANPRGEWIDLSPLSQLSSLSRLRIAGSEMSRENIAYLTALPLTKLAFEGCNFSQDLMLSGLGNLDTSSWQLERLGLASQNVSIDLLNSFPWGEKTRIFLSLPDYKKFFYGRKFDSKRPFKEVFDSEFDDYLKYLERHQKKLEDAAKN